MEYTFYSIINNEGNIIYIGKSTNYKKRKIHHIKSCKNKKLEQYNFKLYQYIRSNGGFDNFKFKILEVKKCDEIESKIIERNYINIFNPKGNCQKPAVINTGLSKSEWEKQYSKLYYENNKDFLKMKDKLYNENNKDIIKIKKKLYYENNKDILKMKSKLYYENNKDFLKMKDKLYYENNKDIIKIKKKLYGENVIKFNRIKQSLQQGKTISLQNYINEIDKWYLSLIKY